MTYSQNIQESGRQLAQAVSPYLNFQSKEVLVVGLSTGGDTLAYEVAKSLGAPFDILVVQTMAMPYHPDLTIGALAAKETCILDEELIHAFRVPDRLLDCVEMQAAQGLQEQEAYYHGQQAYPDLSGWTVVLIYDLLVPDVAMRAAVSSLRARRPKRLIVAAPSLPSQAWHWLMEIADNLVWLRMSSYNR